MKKLCFVEVFCGSFVEWRFFDVAKAVTVLLDKAVVMILLFVNSFLGPFLI
jgi:hypothetical protein